MEGRGAEELQEVQEDKGRSKNLTPEPFSDGTLPTLVFSISLGTTILMVSVMSM